MPLIQSLCLLFLSTVVYFVSRFQNNDLPNFVINEMVAQCEFDPPSKYRDGPYKRGINWCSTGLMLDTERLITHMKQYSSDMDISFASEFGSNVRIGYIVSDNIILINPHIVSRAEEAIWCEDYVGGEILSQNRAESVQVEFLDETLIKRHRWFSRGESCRIQTVIAVM